MGAIDWYQNRQLSLLLIFMQQTRQQLEEARVHEADLMCVEIKPLSSRTLKRLLRVSDVRQPNKSAVSLTAPLDEVVDESAPENAQLVQAALHSLLVKK